MEIRNRHWPVISSFSQLSVRFKFVGFVTSFSVTVAIVTLKIVVGNYLA